MIRSRQTRQRDIPLLTVVAIVIAITAVLVLLWQRRHQVAQSTAPHGVTCRTEGTAAATTVSFQSPTGTVRETGDAIPLTTPSDSSLGRHFTMYGGASVRLSVKNEAETGSVTCVIEVDGVDKARQASNDPFGTATCHSVLP